MYGARKEFGEDLNPSVWVRIKDGFLLGCMHSFDNGKEIIEVVFGICLRYWVLYSGVGFIHAVVLCLQNTKVDICILVVHDIDLIPFLVFDNFGIYAVKLLYI